MRKMLLEAEEQTYYVTKDGKVSQTIGCGNVEVVLLEYPQVLGDSLSPRA